MAAVPDQHARVDLMTCPACGEAISANATASVVLDMAVNVEADAHITVTSKPTLESFSIRHDCRDDLDAGPQTVYLLFDGPPGPEAGRFIEAEDEQGRGVNVGEWLEPQDSTDTYWRLMIRGVRTRG